MRVLVFAAHPDDAEFGAGGVLLRLREQCTLTLCVATDGGAGSHGTSDERIREQEASAHILGAKLIRLGLSDCAVEYTRAFCLQLAQIIRDEQPHVILAPHWDQTGGLNDGRAHPDHRHLGLAVRDAARFARFNIPDLTGSPHVTRSVLWYMVPGTRRAAVVVPIDDQLPALHALWEAHRTQHALRDGAILDHLLHVRTHAATSLRGTRYAECLDSDDPIPVDLLAQLFCSHDHDD